MADFYIAPVARGNGSGSSFDNAAGISNINKVITNASGGDRVFLDADSGNYKITSSINLYAGGDKGNPITIQGIDHNGNEKAATFVSDRAAVFSPTAAQGQEIFRLNSGSDNLIFDNINFKNVNTAFRFTADVSGVTIKDSSATNVSRYIEDMASGTAKTATVTDLTVQNVTVTGFSKGVVRLQYDSNNIVIDNVKGDSQHIDGANFAIGIALDGTTHNVLIKNSVMGNITDTTNAYRNGDGFATELGVYNVTFKDTYSYNNTDAGYDIKSSSTTLINAVSEGNTRNFRFWSDVTAVNIKGIDPVSHGGTSSSSNIWVESDANVKISNSTLVDATGKVASIEVHGNQQGSIALSNVTYSGILGAITKSAAFSVIGSVSKAKADVPVDTGHVTTPPVVTAPPVVTVPPVVTAPPVVTTPPVVALPASEIDKAISALGMSASATSTLLKGSDASDTLVAKKGLLALLGGGGNDILSSNGQAVTLAGGTGSDTYTVDHAGAKVVELADASIDTVKTSLKSYILTDNVDNLSFFGNGAFEGTGNALNNSITGGTGTDTLSGLAGNDTIDGGWGADSIYGGAGNDKLIGGYHLDSIYGDDGDDYIIGDYAAVNSSQGAYGDKLYGGAGNDTIFGDGVTVTGTTAARDNIDGGAGNDIIYGDGETLAAGSTGVQDWLVGGDGDDWIYGDAKVMAAGVKGGDDRITGGAGNDHLFGGRGNDIFIYDTKGTGNDVIHDFGQVEGDRDQIDFGGLGLKFSSLKISYTGGNAVIETPAHDTITLLGVKSLTASDFHF